MSYQPIGINEYDADISFEENVNNKAVITKDILETIEQGIINNESDISLLKASMEDIQDKINNIQPGGGSNSYIPEELQTISFNRLTELEELDIKEEVLEIREIEGE